MNEFAAGQYFEYPETNTHNGAIVTVERVDGNNIIFRIKYYSDDWSLKNLEVGETRTVSTEAFDAFLQAQEAGRTEAVKAKVPYGIYEGKDGLEYELRPGDDVESFFAMLTALKPSVSGWRTGA